jgi:ABC-type multidrug transport system fused ATPase/permease subunit
MNDELRVSPRVRSHDLLDFCIVTFIVSPLLLGVVFVVPALAVLFLTNSSLAALLAIAAVWIAFALFTVSRLTLSSDGIRFHRILGSPKFLPWSRIVSITRAPRWELILRGWFWPPFPAKEMTTSFASVGHYRIQWDSGYCYFPPQFPSVFEQYVQENLGHQKSKI